MVESVSNPKIDMVLQNIEIMVASEGGSLELVRLEPTSLEVKYTPGVNEECPECGPDHDMVKMMLESSLGIYAPQVSELELT